MKRVSAAAVMLIALMLVAEIATAKGGIEQVTVDGPGLERPIEIGDSQILEDCNPWGGLLRFLGEHGRRFEENVVDPSSLVGPYQVRFYGSVHKWVYEFSYYSDEDRDVGYILLPEPNRSQGFVLPGGWYRSSDAWTDVISEQLEGVVMPTEPTASWFRESLPQLLLSLSAMALVGMVVDSRGDMSWARRGRVSSRPGTDTRDA